MNRVDDAVTVAGAQTGPPSEDLSSSSAGWARFTPGTLFAGRFRIVAPLGRGGQFSGKKAQLRLIPSTATTHPAAGQAGDLFLDKTARLWLCTIAGNPATWKRVSLV